MAQHITSLRLSQVGHRENTHSGDASHISVQNGSSGIVSSSVPMAEKRERDSERNFSPTTITTRTSVNGISRSHHIRLIDSPNGRLLHTPPLTKRTMPELREIVPMPDHATNQGRCADRANQFFKVGNIVARLFQPRPADFSARRAELL